MVHAGKLFSAEGGFSQYSIRAGNLKNPKRTSSEVRRGGEKGEDGSKSKRERDKWKVRKDTIRTLNRLCKRKIL